MDDRPWFVYLLRCRGGRIYAGVTPDLPARLRKHRSGTGAAFTRINPPEALLAAKLFPSKVSALAVEYQVKQLSAPQKRGLASTWSEENPIHDLSEVLAALE